MKFKESCKMLYEDTILYSHYISNRHRRVYSDYFTDTCLKYSISYQVHFSVHLYLTCNFNKLTRDISIYSNHVINFLSSPIKLDQFKQKESKGREFTDCNFLFVSVGKN